MKNYPQLAAPFLEEICTTVDATSAWLLQYDAKRSISTVVAEFTAPTANDSERQSDLGEEYPESIHPITIQWLLNSPEDDYFVFQITDLPTDSLAFLEYFQDDIKTALFIRICNQSTVWGYIEIWESRYQKDYDPKTIILIQEILSQMKQALF